MPATADKLAGEAKDLTKELDKISKDLEKRIASAGKDTDAQKLKELRSLKDKWDELSSKSVKVQLEWKKIKNGKDEKEYATFTKFVNSQVVAGRKTEDQIDSLELEMKSDAKGAAAVKKALEQADKFFHTELPALLDEAEKAISNMHHAMVREFPKAASANFRIAADILSKKVEPLVGKDGIEGILSDFAKKNGLGANDLKKESLAKEKLTAEMVLRGRIDVFANGYQKRAAELDKHLDEVRDELKALEEEAKDKAAASTDKNASKQYTAHLNTLLKGYKDAYKEIQKNFSQAETLLEAIATAGKKLNLGNPKEAAKLAEKASSQGEELFTALKNLNKEISTDFSPDPVKKKLKKYEISKADEKKFFDPVLDKVDKVQQELNTVAKNAKTELQNIVTKLNGYTPAKTVGSDDTESKDLASTLKGIADSIKSTLSHAA